MSYTIGTPTSSVPQRVRTGGPGPGERTLAILAALEDVPPELALPIRFDTIREARVAASNARQPRSWLHRAGVTAMRRGTTVFFTRRNGQEETPQ